MATVRTYSPSVRVGNWREDVSLDEDSLKDFLHRKDRGELTLQKTTVLRQNILKPMKLSVSRDGFLRFGDTITLLYLASDHRTFQKCAKKSRLQEVSLVEQCDFQCWWRVVYFDPQERLEHEGYPVQVNCKVLISHCKTNQCLAALANHVLWTPFGKEYELTAHTFLDSHKAEQDSNHWLFVTADPGHEGQSLLQQQQVSTITNENGSHPKAITDTPGESER
ncbi:cilia- and flagella-associated protein 161 isoform X2 [Pygocentrus nattereri]|uniref:cilia- and flagella-associated protein 161 isoform X2 n=1 Tax=Pygocentrus nattereri TaxID=42514 RepID=UPI001891AD62|nr:cilia- and flagella-associated protein 161 isoform X2 [Pygocentrus nattereri]